MMIFLASEGMILKQYKGGVKYHLHINVKVNDWIRTLRICPGLIGEAIVDVEIHFDLRFSF